MGKGGRKVVRKKEGGEKGEEWEGGRKEEGRGIDIVREPKVETAC